MYSTPERSFAALFRIVSALLLASAALAGKASFAGSYLDSDCHALKLKSATGVPQAPVHTYQFSGTCNINLSYDTGPSVLRTVPAVASATWDASRLELKESFHVLAKVHIEGHYNHGGSTFNVNTDISDGEVTSTFKCNDDPLITKSACITTAHANQSGFAPFSNPAKNQSRPLLKGKTTLAEAAGMSKQASAGTPSPAPKSMLSSPKKQQSPIGPVKLVFEGEDLVKAGKFQAAGGKVTVQSMAGFGSAWSAGAQLLWTGGAVGAVLDLAVDIKVPGKYAVELYMTRAPDYANLKLEVDGKASPVPISGFSPKVMPTGPLQAGTFSLQPGQRKLSFMIVGKYPKSTDYFVGLDRVVLTRIGAP